MDVRVCMHASIKVCLHERECGKTFLYAFGKMQLLLSRLIDARLMREARRHLAYTGMRVSSIAYALGFSDLAYFSRVFRRVVGISPRAFRARLEG